MNLLSGVAHQGRPGRTAVPLPLGAPPSLPPPRRRRRAPTRKSASAQGRRRQGLLPREPSPPYGFLLQLNGRASQVPAAGIAGRWGLDPHRTCADLHPRRRSASAGGARVGRPKVGSGRIRHYAYRIWCSTGQCGWHLGDMPPRRGRRLGRQPDPHELRLRRGAARPNFDVASATKKAPRCESPGAPSGRARRDCGGTATSSGSRWPCAGAGFLRLWFARSPRSAPSMEPARRVASDQIPSSFCAFYASSVELTYFAPWLWKH